ncbi:NDR1/HIN1-like protein 1 [Lactuca sativa]|uniref:NDR1/HIN1-like protein 1 n=1 Tax=Lactuca sativa TaxID=4236 RepID=UPI000CB9FD3E|nr:NDR1/HIN1-like protein 1 [Lactuca sativa]
MESNRPPPKMGNQEKQVVEDGNHNNTSRYTRQDTRRGISIFIVVILLLAGITAGVLWIVYHPHKPKFSVVDASVFALNISSTPYISITMQFTIVTRNPNNRVSIYYDHLAAFLFYKNQAITAPLMLPPLYHERDSTVSFSPILGGGSVPVSMEVVNGLETDEGYGAVSFRLVLMGQMRWKYGDIRSGRKGVHVGCDVFVGLKRGVVGQVPLLGSPVCRVDI